MNSNRPYLIRAMYEWIVDNEQVPQVIVDSKYSQVVIPEGLAKDGQIVLNLSIDATHNLVLGNDVVSFSTRFSGKSEDISFPPDAVIGIFARDTGQGMMFEPLSSSKDTDNSTNTDSPKKKPKSLKPALKLVKKNKE
jgi:stringent starvation protein B